MHELAVTQQILDLVLSHAVKHEGRQVTDIHLVIGELSSVVDESVQFYWNFVSQETLAAGATLHFRRIPAEFTCQACARRYHPAADLACPACGSGQVQVTAGEEFYVDAIDIITREEAGVFP